MIFLKMRKLRPIEALEFKQKKNFLALDIRFEMMSHCLLLMDVCFFLFGRAGRLTQILCDLWNLLFMIFLEF